MRCAATGEAVIIDTVLEHAGRDAALARELSLRLVWALATHVHSDHVSGATRLRRLDLLLHTAIGPAARAWTGCSTTATRSPWVRTRCV